MTPEILCWCEEHGFILVTNNRKSMPTHLRDHLTGGRHVPGIIELNPNMTLGQIVEELWLIGGASHEDEYLDRIAFLPVSY